MYRPDARFVRELQAVEDLLYPEWCPHRERWMIKRKSRVFGDPDPEVMLVQGPDGGYRPLDDRVILEIKLADLWRYKNTREFIKVLREKDHLLNQQSRAAFSDYVQQVAKEDLYPAFFRAKPITPGVDVRALG